jgi:hypothetical protein
MVVAARAETMSVAIGFDRQAEIILRLDIMRHILRMDLGDAR